MPRQKDKKIDIMQQQESPKGKENDVEEWNSSEDQQLSDEVRDMIKIKFNLKKDAWSKIPLGAKQFNGTCEVI